MSQRNVLLALAAVVLFVAAGFISFRSIRQRQQLSDDFPDGVWWVCLNPDCGNEFNTSLDEIDEYFNANPEAIRFPCPKCGGTDTMRGTKCEHCDRCYVRPNVSGGTATCPHCGKELRPLAERLEDGGDG
mgnify:CR=1 FL=1